MPVQLYFTSDGKTLICQDDYKLSFWDTDSCKFRFSCDGILRGISTDQTKFIIDDVHHGMERKGFVRIAPYQSSSALTGTHRHHQQQFLVHQDSEIRNILGDVLLKEQVNPDDFPLHQRLMLRSYETQFLKLVDPLKPGSITTLSVFMPPSESDGTVEYFYPYQPMYYIPNEPFILFETGEDTGWSEGNFLRCFHLETLKEIFELSASSISHSPQFSYAPNHEMLIAFGHNNILVVNTFTGDLLGRIYFRNPSIQPSKVDASGEQTWIDVRTNEIVPYPKVLSVGINPKDKDQFAIVVNDHIHYVRPQFPINAGYDEVNWTTDRMLQESDIVEAIAFHPEGNLIAIRLQNKLLSLRNAATDEVVCVFDADLRYRLHD